MSSSDRERDAFVRPGADGLDLIAVVEDDGDRVTISDPRPDAHDSAWIRSDEAIPAEDIR